MCLLTHRSFVPALSTYFRVRAVRLATGELLHDARGMNTSVPAEPWVRDGDVWTVSFVQDVTLARDGTPRGTLIRLLVK